MAKTFFDHNADFGITQWFSQSTDGKEFTIQTTQEVSPYLEAAKKSYNTFDERTPWKGDMHKVAKIPIDLFFKLKKQGVTDDPAKFKRWLNDSENRYFRTRPGRV
jgi:hypothetical protein